MAKGKTHKAAHGPKAEVREHRETVETVNRSILKIGVPTDVQWFELHAFHERNSRVDSFRDPWSDLREQIRPLEVKDGRQETDADRKFTSDGLIGLLLNGWDDRPLEVTIPTDKEIALAIAQRKAKLEEWRTIGEQDGKEVYARIANFVEPIWFPKGESCPILGIVNMGYRRTSAFPAVAYARKVRHVDLVGNYTVPVVAKEYASDLDRFTRHLDENLMKDAGRVKYSPLDFLLIAKQLLEVGGSEANLRKYGNVGEAQRAFALVKLDARYPECNLYARCMAKPISENKCYFAPGDATAAALCDPKVENEELVALGSPIPYRGTNKEQLRALLNDLNYLDVGKKEPRVTTTAVVEEYAKYVTDGGGGIATWNKNDTENILRVGASPEAVRFVGWCMAKAKRGALREFLAEYKDVIDAACKDAGFDMEAWQRRFERPGDGL